MKKLSIIIKACKEKIKNYIDIISPLIKDEDTELIIINSSIKEIGIKCSHVLFNFSESYRGFKDFCFASSNGERVLIIEDGMVITRDIIDKVKSFLIDKENSNLSCSYKIYLSPDKSIYYIYNGVLVYKRGLKGFNTEIDILIEDLSFIEASENDIETCIEKLIKHGNYRDLYSWYENVVLCRDEKFQNKFYEILERKKTEMDSDAVQSLNTIFLGMPFESTYKEYIEARMQFRKNEGVNIDILYKKIKNINFNNGTIYLSWLLYDLLDYNEFTFEILPFINKDTFYKYLSYLFDNSCYFSNQIYDFILDTPSTLIDYNKLKIYLNIVKQYVHFISNNYEVSDIKHRLLSVFYRYMEISQKFLEGLEKSDFNFVKEVCKANSYIEEGNIEEGILLLKSAAQISPVFIYAVLCHIQNIRYKYNCYPYVLSICMIVKNEEKNISRCLSSLDPLLAAKLAELIIIDTGSTDDTVKISRNFTSKVYCKPWDENFSKARNYSILHANGEYILILDADEEFKKEAVLELAKKFSDTKYKNYNTFSFKLINYTDIHLKEYVILTQPRIFKNDGSFYYSSSVHNQPIFHAPVKNLDILIHHYGYIMTEDIRERKFQRTATLLKNELEKDPRNIYYRFQLSTSYAMYGDEAEALRHVEIYMRNIKELGSIEENHLMYLNNAASIYIANSLNDEALDICDIALAIKPDFIDFIFYKLFILYSKQEYKEALEYIYKYLNIVDNFYEMDISHDGRFSFYSVGLKDDVLKLMVLSSYFEEKYLECIDGTFKIKNDSILKSCIHAFVNSCFKLKDFKALSTLCSDRILKNEGNNFTKVFNFFLMNNLFKYGKEACEKCALAFSGYKSQEKYINDITTRYENNQFFTNGEIIFLINNYDLDDLDINSILPIFNSFINSFKKFIPSDSEDFSNICSYKRFAQFVLHRALEIRYFKNYYPDKLLGILKKYIDLCTYISNKKQNGFLDFKENQFLLLISAALKEFSLGNTEGFVKLSIRSTAFYKKMEGIASILIETLAKENKKIEEIYDFDKNEYVLILKEKLACHTEENNIESILELFKEYNKEDLYDPQLFSFKAIVLMGSNRFNEAEAVLKKGLGRFPTDTTLLYNMARIYNFSLKNKEALKYFIKSKLLSAEFNNEINYKNFIKDKSLNDTSLKVLIGTLDLTDKTEILTSGLKKSGIYVKSINYYPGNKHYNSDYIVDVNIMNSGLDILINSSEAAARLISEFNIFHFNFGTTLTFHHNDLAVLKDLDKRVLMHFWGNDARIYSKASKLNPYIRGKVDKDDITKRNLDFYSKYVSSCIAADYEVYEYLKDFFNDIHVIPPAIDLEKYKPFFNKNRDGKITIVHAPSSSEAKGTKHIISAINDLKISYDIDFKIIQGLPHNQAVKIYRNADLVIDQVITGSYGQLAIEAMALGKPVICYISDFMKDKYPSSLPIISANPDDIKDKIEYTIKNRDMLYDLGKMGRNYVENFHEINRIVKNLIMLYDEILQQ